MTLRIQRLFSLATEHQPLTTNYFRPLKPNLLLYVFFSL